MRILTFGASWCPSCKEMHRLIGDVTPVLEIDYVDIDQRSALANRYQVHSIPTIIQIDYQGIEQKRLVGYHPLSKIKSWLSNG